MRSELTRVLEPEVMDGPDEVAAYDAMDHSAVNRLFAQDFLAAHGPMRGGEALDVGTGTARIPVEICRLDEGARARAVDLAPNMLARAREVVDGEGLSDRIVCELVDAKGLPWPDGSFEAVISNTILHHVPEPAGVVREMARLVAPGGTLFVRDLARPVDQERLDHFVATYAGREAPEAQKLFADSLRAALTLEEAQATLEGTGVPPSCVTMTSDRHWTISWRR